MRCDSPHGEQQTRLPAQIHRIYSSLPLSCCIPEQLFTDKQPMNFVPRWVAYAEQQSSQQPAYTLQIVGTSHLNSQARQHAFLSLRGNVCTVSFVDLLPFLATSTWCSELCGNYSASLLPWWVLLFSPPGKAAPACAFLGISYSTLFTACCFCALLGP